MQAHELIHNLELCRDRGQLRERAYNMAIDLVRNSPCAPARVRAGATMDLLVLEWYNTGNLGAEVVANGTTGRYRVTQLQNRKRGTTLVVRDAEQVAQHVALLLLAPVVPLRHVDIKVVDSTLS